MSKPVYLVDPNGLLEYSIVFTERSLNHMSISFQNIMRDISVTLKKVYNAHSVALVPGGATDAMASVARQFATNKKTLMIRNGWISFRWTQIFEIISIHISSTIIKARQVSSGSQGAFAPPSVEEIVDAIN
jgi:aspartate aminotransferase-like enzyme